MLFKLLSLILYAIVAIASLVFAGLYLFRKKLMPYHLEAIDKKWEDIDPKYRIIFMALFRMTGLGFLMGAFLILSQFYVFWTYDLMRIQVSTLIFTYSMIFWIITFFITSRARKKSQANIPANGCLIAIIITGLGYLLSWFA